MQVSTSEWIASDSMADEPVNAAAANFETAMPKLQAIATSTTPVDPPADTRPRDVDLILKLDVIMGSRFVQVAQQKSPATGTGSGAIPQTKCEALWLCSRLCGFLGLVNDALGLLLGVLDDFAGLFLGGFKRRAGILLCLVHGIFGRDG